MSRYRAKAAVSAWLPYEPQTNVDISDQSEGFAVFDYLAATAESQCYYDPVNLHFNHKMAKVKYILKVGDGLTDEDIADVKVSIGGYTSASFGEGIVYGHGNGWITPTADCRRRSAARAARHGRQGVYQSIVSQSRRRDFGYAAMAHRALVMKFAKGRCLECSI